MFGSNDIGFMRFVVKVTPTSGKETIRNTYERLLDLNNHVDTLIALSSRFKTLEESSPLRMLETHWFLKCK